MNILPDERGQVYLFTPGEFGLQGKRFGDDVFLEIGKACDALHADPYGDSTGCEDPSLAQSHIQRIRQRRDRHGACLLQVQATRILFSLHVDGVPLWNLANMNFHGLV